MHRARDSALGVEVAVKVLARTEPLVRIVSAPGPLPVTSTDTFPACPMPAVVLLMSPKPEIDKAPAVTVT